MDLNFLKFQTNKGTKLIFDNCTGFVIHEKNDTEYLLTHIDDDINSIIKGLKDLNIYDKEEFNLNHSYIKSLITNGYFNNKMLNNNNEPKAKNLFNGLSSHLILITTEDCNLRCKYCVYSDCYADKKTYSSKYMSIETALKAIDLFKVIHEDKIKRGYKNQPKINFYGGEPLLNFKIIKAVVDYINEINFENVEYLITTNGTVINDHIIDFLAKNNFLISFSLDGDLYNHDRNRVSINDLPTHEIVMKNMIKYYDKLLLYRKDSMINISCCFDNYTDMVEVTDFFEKMRSRINNLNIMYNKVYEMDTTYYDFCEDRYKNVSDLINKDTYSKSVKLLFEKHYGKQEYDNIPKSVKSIFTSYYLLKNRKKGMIDLYQGNACIVGDKLCVSPDENIYICEKANQEISIGDLTNGLDLKKINKLYETYYDIREKYCSKCSINRLCDVCYVHFIKNDKLVYNEEFCNQRRNVFIRGLEVVYSSLEEDTNIFDFDKGGLYEKLF